jgi:hypothetical protein
VPAGQDNGFKAFSGQAHTLIDYSASKLPTNNEDVIARREKLARAAMMRIQNQEND